VLILSEDRFHLALVPYVAILAAQFWLSRGEVFYMRWNQSQIGKVIVLMSILAVICLVTNWGMELNHDWDKIAQLLGPNGNQSYFPY
jgi:hypothetical protein